MPTIRISDDTWQRLKSWAIPLEDTPDDAIKKVIDTAEGKVIAAGNSAKHVRPKPINKGRRSGKKLPQREFRIPLMKALQEFGGRASTRELRPIMEERMSHRLLEGDFETVSTGEPRWWNAICWERNDLVKEGLFRQDSERGVWELSQFGVEFIDST